MAFMVGWAAKVQPLEACMHAPQHLNITPQERSLLELRRPFPGRDRAFVDKLAHCERVRWAADLVLEGSSYSVFRRFCNQRC